MLIEEMFIFVLLRKSYLRSMFACIIPYPHSLSSVRDTRPHLIKEISDQPQTASCRSTFQPKTSTMKSFIVLALCLCAAVSGNY